MGVVLYNAFAILIRLLDVFIIIRVLMSWFPIDRNNPFVKIIYTLTEPILAPIRKMLFNSPLGGQGMMLDFSPIIAMLLFDLILNALRYTIV